MITNFPKKKSYNPGGLRSFRFVHASSVLAFPAILNGKVSSAVQLVADHEWLTGYATAYTSNFIENAKQSPHGVYYEQSLSGLAPGDYVELLDLIQSKEDQDFVLLVEDARGQIRLVGGFGFPLRFLSDYSSGSARSDMKGFDFKFSGIAPFRAPVYQI